MDSIPLLHLPWVLDVFMNEPVGTNQNSFCGMDNPKSNIYRKIC